MKQGSKKELNNFFFLYLIKMMMIKNLVGCVYILNIIGSMSGHYIDMWVLQRFLYNSTYSIHCVVFIHCFVRSFRNVVYCIYIDICVTHICIDTTSALLPLLKLKYISYSYFCSSYYYCESCLLYCASIYLYLVIVDFCHK